jgi:hypothetical protein
MRVGIATDQGGFSLKEDLLVRRIEEHPFADKQIALLMPDAQVKDLYAFNANDNTKIIPGHGGLLAGWSVEFAWLFFIGTTGVVLVVIGYLWWRLPDDRWLASLGYSLILTGALGNLWDRIRLGYVVDFIQVHWHDWYFPAFNVADSAITVGAACLLVDAWLSGRQS